MTGGRYAVALYTFGSFHGWASDPMTLAEAEEFVENPASAWAPRPQDRLVTFELFELSEVS